MYTSAFGGLFVNRKVIITLAASVFFSALVQLCPAQDNCPRQRLVSVVGTAEINVAPDEVVLSLGVESHDKVLGVAKSQNDARANKVMTLARSAGVEPKDIQTGSLRMGPDYSEEKVPRLLGYDVSQTIAITLRDLSKYEALMTQLLEAGVNRVDGISFRIAEPRKYRDEARSKAIRAAKEKAVAMATELGQTVGKPWEISEEGGSGMLNVVTRGNANYASDRDKRSVTEESTVAPGQVTINASVSVSFQLE
jgi:uncharacterized protein